jgi:predicted HAD superfamily Cof-like phosphohydrolase
MTDAQFVRIFTEEARDIKVPDKPQIMTQEEVYFLTKMKLDELMEFMATVAGPEEAKLTMIKMITDSKNIPQCTGTETEIIAEQADALVDDYFYSLDAGARKGINLSSIFKIVFKANMDKRDPTTGKFIKRADGKIIKPVGWTPPDIVKEIIRQTTEGSWKSS